jgi:hypothetical protein
MMEVRLKKAGAGQITQNNDLARSRFNTSPAIAASDPHATTSVASLLAQSIDETFASSA